MMKKIKDLFSTPKKAILTSLCILLVLAIIGTGTTYATGVIVKNASIGETNAQNFAFADAGIDPLSAQVLKTEFDREQGQFVYEIEFIANGTEYEYWVRATDGSIVKKELKVLMDNEVTGAVLTQISVEQAKEIAVNDAGLTSANVVFTKAELDRDNVQIVYDIDFYNNNEKYEYEINAETGAIFSKSKETFILQENSATDNTNGQNTRQEGTVVMPSTSTQNSTSSNKDNSGQISLDKAKETALSDAGVSADEVVYTKAKLDYDDGVAVYEIDFYTSTHEYDYEINATTAAIMDKSVEVHKVSSGNNTNAGNAGASYIGVDKAKSIAVSHAGLSVSSVYFFKAKLENDDGKAIYEIEFYQDRIEYDYEIDAKTGEILEFNSERD